MKKAIFLPLSFMLLAGSLSADDSFFSDDSMGGFGDEAASAVQIGGHITTSVQTYLNEDSFDALADLDNDSDAVEASIEAGLTFDYEGANFATHTDILVSPQESEVTVNEAYAQYFGENITFEGGLMKVVWGKADEFHVVDVLNNMNLSQFLLPDYLEMIDAELMFKMNIPVGMNSNLEVAYIPVLTPHEIPGSGSMWEPMETKTELPAILGYYDGLGLTTNELPAVDTNTLDYSQAALHFTSSVAGLDYGFTYYAGYNKMPTVNLVQNGANLDYWISYDPMHVFGVEAAYIVAGFNLKGEFAYNMTYDFEGDDPRIHNNSLNWVGGFDRDIPLGNLNINIQETGSVVLANDEILAGDIEYSDDDTYTNNMLIVALTDKFFHDKLETKLIGFYHFEESDFGVYPSVEVTPADDFTITAEARIFGGEEDTFFGQYKDNSLVNLSLSWNY